MEGANFTDLHRIYLYWWWKHSSFHAMAVRTCGAQLWSWKNRRLFWQQLGGRRLEISCENGSLGSCYYSWSHQDYAVKITLFCRISSGRLLVMQVDWRLTCRQRNTTAELLDLLGDACWALNWWRSAQAVAVATAQLRFYGGSPSTTPGSEVL